MFCAANHRRQTKSPLHGSHSVAGLHRVPTSCFLYVVERPSSQLSSRRTPSVCPVNRSHEQLRRELTWLKGLGSMKMATRGGWPFRPMTRGASSSAEAGAASDSGGLIKERSGPPE